MSRDQQRAPSLAEHGGTSSIPEFHNLLISNKLLNQSHLGFSDFQRFPTLW